MDKQVPIFLSDILAGTLSQNANGILIFKYDNQYLTNEKAIPLS